MWIVKLSQKEIYQNNAKVKQHEETIMQYPAIKKKVSSLRTCSLFKKKKKISGIKQSENQRKLAHTPYHLLEAKLFWLHQISHCMVLG